MAVLGEKETLHFAVLTLLLVGACGVTQGQGELYDGNV